MAQHDLLAIIIFRPVARALRGNRTMSTTRIKVLIIHWIDVLPELNTTFRAVNVLCTNNRFRVLGDSRARASRRPYTQRHARSGKRVKYT